MELIPAHGENRPNPTSESELSTKHLLTSGIVGIVAARCLVAAGVVLTVVWLPGVVSHYTMGGPIHGLLMVAMGSASVGLMQG